MSPLPAQPPRIYVQEPSEYVEHQQEEQQLSVVDSQVQQVALAALQQAEQMSVEDLRMQFAVLKVQNMALNKQVSDLSEVNDKLLRINTELLNRVNAQQHQILDLTQQVQIQQAEFEHALAELNGRCNALELRTKEAELVAKVAIVASVACVAVGVGFLAVNVIGPGNIFTAAVAGIRVVGAGVKAVSHAVKTSKP